MEEKVKNNWFSLPKNQNDLAELEGLFSMYSYYHNEIHKPANKVVTNKICSKINEIIAECLYKYEEK